MGLDIWYENTTAVHGFHRRVCVDICEYKDCKLVKSGKKYCISFGVDGRGMGSGSGGSPNNPSAPSSENGGSSDSGSSDNGGSSHSNSSNQGNSSASSNVDNDDGKAGNGVVYEDNEDPATKEVERTKTSCKQDKKILKKLKSMRGNRANYNICTQTCRHFSEDTYNDLKDTEE